MLYTLAVFGIIWLVVSSIGLFLSRIYGGELEVDFALIALWPLFLALLPVIGLFAMMVYLGEQLGRRKNDDN